MYIIISQVQSPTKKAPGCAQDPKPCSTYLSGSGDLLPYGGPECWIFTRHLGAFVMDRPNEI